MLMLLMVTLFAGRGVTGVPGEGAIGLTMTVAGEGALPPLLRGAGAGATGPLDGAAVGERPARLMLSSLYSDMLTHVCMPCPA